MRTARSLTILGGVPARGCLPKGVPAQGGVTACDLSHHAFDVTCVLSCHQLRLTTSAAAYIVFGHVTCGACWDTTPSPVDIAFATSFVGGKNAVTPLFQSNVSWRSIKSDVKLKDRCHWMLDRNYAVRNFTVADTQQIAFHRGYF